MTVSICSKMIQRILQFSMQVPAMLGFSSPSFNLTFKYDQHGWHPHCQHVPLCKDKATSTVEEKGRFCKLNSTGCRQGSDYPDSITTNCQVCFIMSSVMFAMSGTSCFKLCFDRPCLVTNIPHTSRAGTSCKNQETLYNIELLLHTSQNYHLFRHFGS